MRAIAVKNFAAHTRIIAQMLLHTNKAYLSNIPDWSREKDDALCLVRLVLRCNQLLVICI